MDETFKNRFMVTLHGYFDESGKSHEHDVVVFAGFVTTWKWWEELGEEWSRVLWQHNIPALHFKEHQKRTSLLKKFIHLIKRYVELGVSISVKTEAFNALPERVQKRLGGDPHYLAFKAVVIHILNHALVDPGTTLAFTCDEDEATFRNCYAWYKDLKRENSDARARLVSFCGADDRCFPQLQAADLFAGLQRAQAETRLLGREARHVELLEALATEIPDQRLKARAMDLAENDLWFMADQWDQWQLRLAGELPKGDE